MSLPRLLYTVKLCLSSDRQRVIFCSSATFLNKVVFQNAWSNQLKRSVVWVKLVEKHLTLNQLQMPIKHLISAFNPHFFQLTGQAMASIIRSFSTCCCLIFHQLISSQHYSLENRTCIRLVLNCSHKILPCHACFRRPVIISFIGIDW